MALQWRRPHSLLLVAVLMDLMVRTVAVSPPARHQPLCGTLKFNVGHGVGGSDEFSTHSSTADMVHHTYVIELEANTPLFAPSYTMWHWSSSHDAHMIPSNTSMIECHYHGISYLHNTDKNMLPSMNNAAVSARGYIDPVTGIISWSHVYGLIHITYDNAGSVTSSAFVFHPQLSSSSASSAFQTSSQSTSSISFESAALGATSGTMGHHWNDIHTHTLSRVSTTDDTSTMRDDDFHMAVCALKHSMSTSSAPPSSSSSSSSSRMDVMADTRTRYVELLLVNDHARYANLTTDTEWQTAAIANMAALLYSSMTSPPVQIVLVAQITFVATDPYTVSSTSTTGGVAIESLMSSFNRWRVDTGSTLAAHDAGHLLTGRIITDGTVGLATLGGLCVASVSGGVEQSLNDQSLVYTAVAVAHELGHNFGMLHVGGGSGETSCSAAGAVMASSFCRNCALSTFSFTTCDIAALQSFVSTSQSSCLDNVPTRRWNDTSSGAGVCGDGVVNSNEACDCGGDDCSTTDACCNGVTCQLIAGATCSARDICCDACQIVTAINQTVCRASTGSCDVTEYCNGISSLCPLDRWQPQGMNCTASLVTGYDPVGGQCHRGTCASYESQCERYGRHTDPTANYTQCPPLIRSMLAAACTRLLCVRNGNTGGCFGFTVDGAMVQVEDGIACGNDQQCYNHQCMDTDAISLFQWYITDWSECNDGTGVMTRQAVCRGVQEGLSQVSDSLCPLPVPSSMMTCPDRASVSEQTLYWSVSFVLTTISMMMMIMMILQYRANAALRARSIAPVLLQLYGDALMTAPNWMLYFANLIDPTTHGDGLCGISVFFFTMSFIVQAVACILIGWAGQKQINNVLAARGGTWVSHRFLVMVTTVAGLQCGWWVLALYLTKLGGSFHGFFCMARDFGQFASGGILLLIFMISFGLAAIPLSRLYKTTTAPNYPNTVLALHVREQIGFATLLVFSWLLCWFLWMIMILQDVSGHNIGASLVIGSMWILQLKPIIDCLLIARIPSVVRQWTWTPCRAFTKKRTNTGAGSNGRIAVTAPRGVEVWTAATPHSHINGATSTTTGTGASNPISSTATYHPLSLEMAAIGADGARLAAAADAVAANDLNRIATTLCPICGSAIPDWQIEMHADECLNGPPTKSRAASSTLHNDDGKRSGSSAASNASYGNSHSKSNGTPPRQMKQPKKGKPGSKIVSGQTAAAAPTTSAPPIYLGPGLQSFPASQLANAPRAPLSAAAAMAASHSHWSCTICTLKNPRNRPNCSACSSPRPFDL